MEEGLSQPEVKSIKHEGHKGHKVKPLKTSAGSVLSVVNALVYALLRLKKRSLNLFLFSRLPFVYFVSFVFKKVFGEWK
jgi:hypothetical protein